MSNENSGFGTPKYGANGDFAKRFKIETPKKGATSVAVYSIFPPMKELAARGIWRVYHRQHFGYSGRDTRDQTRLRARPFGCIEEKDRNTKIVKVACPECKERSRQEAKMEQLKAQAVAAGKTPEQIAAVVSGYEAWLKQHNLDKKYHCHVENEKGELGTLAFGHNFRVRLDKVIEDLQQLGIDPLSLDRGVKFVFERSWGEDNKLIDTVKVFETTTNEGGRVMKEIQFRSISQETRKRALEILPDLTQIPVSLTAEQIQRLVESQEDPDLVDSIFNGSQRKPVDKPVADKKPAATASAPTKAPVDEVAELRAKLAALEAAAAKPAAPATDEPIEDEPEPDPEPEVKTATSASPEDIAKMDDKKFMSMFGAKTAGSTAGV